MALLFFLCLVHDEVLVHPSCVCRNHPRGGEQEGHFQQAKAAQSSSVHLEREVLETGKRNRTTTRLDQVPLLTLTPAPSAAQAPYHVSTKPCGKILVEYGDILLSTCNVGHTL